MLQNDTSPTPEKKLWWKSRTFVLSLGLVLGALYWALQSYQVVNAADVAIGVEIAPQLDNAIQLARDGQWISAATAIFGVLLAYFRAQARGPLRF